MESAEELKDLANKLFRDGRFRECISLYDQCLRSPNVNDELREIVFCNKSLVFLKLSEYKSAASCASEALKLNPSDVKALFRRAQAHENLGNFNDALTDIQRLMQLNPKNTSAQQLARKIQMTVTSRIAEASSVPARISKTFDVIVATPANDVHTVEQALNNLAAIVSENGPTAASLIWSDSNISSLFELCKSPEHKLVAGTHCVLALLFEHHADRCLFVLNRLSPKYFVDRIYSRRAEESSEACRFLNALLEGLTQLKAYHEAKEANKLKRNHEMGKVAPVSYPRFKLDPLVEDAVLEILRSLFRSTNSFRLFPQVRDYILEMLIRFVPSEKGIGCSQSMVDVEGNLDRLLEVSGVAGSSALSNRRANPRHLYSSDETKSIDANTGDNGPLKTTQNTRMIVACLLSKLWDDLRSDKARDAFTSVCNDFIVDLFSDPFLETKVEAASVIGTLFLGPYEIGSSILSRSEVLQGLFLLAQSSNMLHQTIALDTIILATNKKEQCLNLVSKAVPVLRKLYRSENDKIKIRALVALCKFGAAGGSDASIKSLTEGSACSLMRACQRVLLGITQLETDLEQISAVPQPKPDISETGELVLNEESDDDFEEQLLSNCQRNKRVPMPSNVSASFLKESETVRWAIEGLAYLSLKAEVKQELAEDASGILPVLFQVASLNIKECGFALASVLAHITNSLPRTPVEPELVELAKFAKQHIPEDHPLDSEEHVKRRRQLLMNAGLSAALYDLAVHVSEGLAGAQLGLRELISRLYLAASEEVSHRGMLAQSGASKALLNLTLKNNTDAGKAISAQSLARLTITADPRVTFAGQRSLEIVRPLLQLLSPDCDGLQNFEGLLALTNLASIDERHQHRIMAERGIPLVDHYLFDDHPLLRRAAVEFVTNMAQYHPFVVACGGTIPLDEQDFGTKLPYLSSSTERVKLLVLYCGELDDLLLVRAAVGALAAMSYDPGIIIKITDTSSWFETVQTLAGHNACSIQHRTAHLLRNMVVHGERSLSEYFCKSNMLEVIMALSQLPDITLEESIPEETVSMNPGISMEEIRQQNITDRRRTRECALEALTKLQKYGLVERNPTVP